jgi:hypothetical protein
MPTAFPTLGNCNISEVWTRNATATTDTDADGLSDYAEFMAGTDPNNPPPPFALTAHPLPDGFVQLTWPSVSNHVYRVLGSTNFNTWLPCSDWLTAEGTNTTFKLAIPAPGTPHFFRVETAVPSGPSERAAVFSFECQSTRQ